MTSPTTPLEYALAYAALGWPVLPLRTIRNGMCSCGVPECKSPGKHPAIEHGLHDASTDEARIRAWWTAMPDANIGIRTGRASGIVAIDLDTKADRDGAETWRALCTEHGAPPDTVEAITGSGGRHLLFAYPDVADEIPSGSNVLGPGVDHRAENGYIVVEPGRHRSGRQYWWEASSSPLDGTTLAPLPAWIVRALQAPRTARPAASTTEPPPLPADRVRELRSALAFIPSDERDIWLRVGMALHAEHPGQQGYGLWTEWSQSTPDKFDPKKQRYTWDHFKSPEMRDRAVLPASIFGMARDLGWVSIQTPGLIEPTVIEFSRAPLALIRSATPDPTDIPAELLTPPGVLADIAAYGVASAVRPVPIFAVQAALALGSVICARRFMTSQRNYASLYFLNVAKSGTGKEEAKTTIEAILTAANARRLVGGSSYSSGNAVYSALLRRPQHIAIIDEFGKYMEAANGTRDNYRADALTMLMESFGRVHADMSTPQFSTMTVSNKAAADHEPRIIARPAITLLAMATPSSFYGALSSTRVLDGFLNRFLIVEHTGARAPMQDWQDVPVPERAVAWIKQLLAGRGDLDSTSRADMLPDPWIVPLTESALRLSRSFERDMLTLADRLEPAGLGDMPIRTREIGLRLALIAALADTPDTPVITDDILAWCFRYVRYFLEQTTAALRDRLADSEHERARKVIYREIVAAAERGLSNKEFHRCPPIAAIPKRLRQEAMEALMAAEMIAWAEIHSGGRGRPRKALVAIADTDEGEERAAS